VLQSTAADTRKIKSIESPAFKGKGGGMQYFSIEKPNFLIQGE